jgi:type IV fimbrial biogenesis protein
MMSRKYRGFTILELMVVLAILGVLVTMAAPSYRDMLAREKVRSALNEWQSSFYFAQSEALRLKDGVVFCSSVDGQTCSGHDNFGEGWIVLHRDVNNNKNIILQDVAFSRNDLSIILTPGALKGSLSFFGTGWLRINAGPSVEFKKVGYDNSKLKLNISAAGRLNKE